MGLIQQLKPKGIECLDWESAGDASKPSLCRYYAAGGGCSVSKSSVDGRPRFMCEEWARRNEELAFGAWRHIVQPGTQASQASVDALRRAQPAPAVPAPPSAAAVGLPDYPKNLIGEPLREGEQPGVPDAPYRRRYVSAAQAAAAAAIGRPEVAGALGGASEDAPPPIDPAWVDSMNATGLEMRLETKLGPDVFVVPKRTGADRTEVTYGEAALMRLILDVFPGARMVSLTRGDDTGSAPQAASAHRDEGDDELAVDDADLEPEATNRPPPAPRCPACGQPVRKTDSGMVCDGGHALTGAAHGGA